jgi:hypothetical protein
MFFEPENPLNPSPVLTYDPDQTQQNDATAKAEVVHLYTIYIYIKHI